MKKEIIIIVTIVLVTALGITGFCVYKEKMKQKELNQSAKVSEAIKENEKDSIAEEQSEPEEKEEKEEAVGKQEEETNPEEETANEETIQESESVKNEENQGIAEESETPQVQSESVTGTTYTTKYAQTNAVTTPVFQFEYPEGWNVQTENVDAGNVIEENVVISNPRGITVTYWDCQTNLGGNAKSMLKAEISKAADSSFVAGYPAGTDKDCSGLGTFVVAKVQLVGEMIPGLDSDYMSIDKAFYAVVPESYIGEREFQGQAGNVDEFSFEYPNPRAFIAESPDGTFTAEEEQQVIRILKSFKIAQ